MNLKNLVLVASAVGYVLLFANTVSATGAGVCVLGNGGDFNDGGDPVDPSDSTFVGVNAGLNSQTGAFTDQASFETQCCAESGKAPDCFAPVGGWAQPFALGTTVLP
ncbi:MAG: hypothetical protein ACYDCK_05135 [Thermoplasmatota archaeon]